MTAHDKELALAACAYRLEKATTKAERRQWKDFRKQILQAPMVSQ